MSEIDLKKIDKPEKSFIKKTKGFRAKIKAFFANPKKKLIFIFFMFLVLVGIIGVGAYFLTHNNTPVKGGNIPPVVAKQTTPPTQKYLAVLDGVMTDQESANRHPLAIMVENHPDARPQAGLDKADEVYEAIAEGGITRFMALYGSNEAEKVGPVRSTRTYFVDWADDYNAFLAHVGGNMDALQLIPKDGILDLDQFKYSAPYWRQLSSGLATEHTMYTSTAKLRTQAATNKYPTDNNFTIYKYKDDPQSADLPAAQTIVVNFSSADYKATFDYDKTTNSYKRFIAGKPDNDQLTKEQLNPKDIVVMTVNRQPTITSINEQGYNMTTEGSGKARFYIDGKETTGTWKKDSSQNREMFYDASGNEITFDRGQLWICVIPPESTVTVN